MKQVAYFTLPGELDKVNAFLAKNPPENVATNKDSIIINYDDQSYPDAYIAEELRGLLLSNTKNTMTTEISLSVMRHDLDKKEKELAELNGTSVNATGKEKYELTADRSAKIKAYEQVIENIKQSIAGMESSISTSEVKIAILSRKLSELNLE